MAYVNYVVRSKRMQLDSKFNLKMVEKRPKSSQKTGAKIDPRIRALLAGKKSPRSISSDRSLAKRECEIMTPDGQVKTLYTSYSRDNKSNYKFSAAAIQYASDEHRRAWRMRNNKTSSPTTMN